MFDDRLQQVIEEVVELVDDQTLQDLGGDVGVHPQGLGLDTFLLLNHIPDFVE